MPLLQKSMAPKKFVIIPLWHIYLHFVGILFLFYRKMKAIELNFNKSQTNFVDFLLQKFIKWHSLLVLLWEKYIAPGILDRVTTNYNPHTALRSQTKAVLRLQWEIIWKYQRLIKNILLVASARPLISEFSAAYNSSFSSCGTPALVRDEGNIQTSIRKSLKKCGA